MDEPVDVVLSVGTLDPVVLLLREFLHRSGAVRACAVVDSGPEDGPVVVDVARLQPVEVAWQDRTVQLPHAQELAGEPLGPVPDVKQLPPYEVDVSEGTVTSTIGGLEHHADAMRALADVLGGRNVAMATFPTTDSEHPLTITARIGEPLLLSLGEHEFEFADGR